MSTETVEILYPSESNYQDIFGCGDRNVRMVEDRYGVQVVCRDGAVKVIGGKTAAKKAGSLALFLLHFTAAIAAQKLAARLGLAPRTL